MKRKWTAYLLFALGFFLLEIHTTIAALWSLFGISGPSPLTATSGLLYYLQGLTPPLGILAMLLAGLVFGAETRKERP